MGSIDELFDIKKSTNTHLFEFISVGTWYSMSDLVIDSDFKRGGSYEKYEEEFPSLSAFFGEL